MTRSLRRVLTAAAAVLAAAWAAPAAAEGGCPAGMMPSGQQQAGTENSGVYIPVCVPGSRNGGGDDAAAPSQPVEAWRRVLAPLTRPPKGWQPLWLAFREYKNWRTKESHYILTAGHPTYAAAVEAYQTECLRVNGPQFNIGSCMGWSADQSTYFSILRSPDNVYTIGYGNSPEETLNLPTCNFYAQQARELGRTELLGRPCAVEVIGIYRNAIVPEPKGKRKR
ncbi:MULTISPECIES: hypothetical protein [unclassified Sphingopyxis]|jgi:hypothetical protein|uniref:hypothetical protein n=1 Tax=unclassified Sphingopyxis TaxID=2614943 RepID=UPI0025D01243|nr:MULTISPECIES: hypothetical protein [unclassified Sphingopyxis]